MTTVPTIVIALITSATPAAAMADDHGTVLADLRARVATAEALAGSTGGYTMRYLGSRTVAGVKERACITIDAETDAVGLRTTTDAGCGRTLMVLTNRATFSRLERAFPFFGTPPTPIDHQALRLIGKPRARWSRLTNSPVPSVADNVAADFAIGEMIESALLDVADTTDALATPTEITIAGHSANHPKRTTTLRFTFTAGLLSSVITTGHNPSRVSFDYTPTAVRPPEADRSVAMVAYQKAMLVTRGAQEIRSITPHLQRAVDARAAGSAPVAALRRAIRQWRVGRLAGVESTGLGFRTIARTRDGMVFSTRSRFGRLVVSVTWDSAKQLVRTRTLVKELRPAR